VYTITPNSPIRIVIRRVGTPLVMIKYGVTDLERPVEYTLTAYINFN
jgi:hypothetical protein